MKLKWIKRIRNCYFFFFIWKLIQSRCFYEFLYSSIVERKVEKFLEKFNQALDLRYAAVENGKMGNKEVLIRREIKEIV